jgi:hypothetical protein
VEQQATYIPAVRQSGTVTTLDDRTLGSVLVKSGYFKDARDEAQAIVKVLAGRELGLGPVASMTGIFVVEGKPTLGSNLIAALVKRSGKYNYRVPVSTATECAIDWFEGGQPCGRSSFTMQEAQAANLAGKGPWRSYPKAMLFARALTQGARMFCADIFAGPIYTPEELGAEVSVTEDGDQVPVVIEAEVHPARVSPEERREALRVEAPEAAAQCEAQAAPETYRCEACGVDLMLTPEQVEKLRRRGYPLLCAEHGKEWAERKKREREAAKSLSEADGTEGMEPGE